MKFDFSFDERVARQYEEQRRHPAEVSRQIGAAIVDLAGAGADILEIGVGTGRIARPATEAGCRVVGLDLSGNMLAEVKRALADQAPFALLQADMHQLPMPAQHFDAVMAVHVLHLATDWQQVVRECVRVLRPGGVFIQGDDWIDPESVTGRLRDELRRQAMALYPDARPPAAGIAKESFWDAMGATAKQTMIAAEWTTWLSPNERLNLIEQRMDAESWMFPQPIFDQLFARLQAYASATWADLDAQLPVTRRFNFTVTTGNWGHAA
ncbi:MAG: class I SAM-dependent methyltransferase [Anaerolineales bacterium]|nr:class I SAM-dependent methyltransferase [Anaerolineales bacterium]